MLSTQRELLLGWMDDDDDDVPFMLLHFNLILLKVNK